MNVDYRDQPQQSRWSRGLCHGGEDVTACYITCFLPCITFGQIAETVDEGRSSCVNQSTVYGLLFTIQCHWFYSWLYRDKLRQKFGMPEEPCSDCCVHFWCYACALCQEHAELKHRGFNPSKGWTGPPTVAPQVPPSMFK
ncbi:cell number regulator 7-like [Pyrus ussuriensis x Pyrus communis]|uniref:Cell number regulator 7-like n=1 Tax=Pyrus ussuriensis x Pyrus communis TaxID=2448454 RepID=A0A5N5HHM1_9ROSA|nr:cell number regulator 7-like [Pyrus ussuriensis x Pyrus communis]